MNYEADKLALRQESFKWVAGYALPRDFFSLLSISPATSLASSPAGPQFFLLHAIKRGSLFRLDHSTSHSWESGV